jgi:hypothetical protein
MISMPPDYQKKLEAFATDIAEALNRFGVPPDAFEQRVGMLIGFVWAALRRGHDAEKCRKILLDLVDDIERQTAKIRGAG